MKEIYRLRRAAVETRLRPPPGATIMTREQDFGADPAFVASPSSREGVSTKGFNPGGDLDSSRCRFCGQGPGMHSVVGYTVICKPGATDLKDRDDGC